MSCCSSLVTVSTQTMHSLTLASSQINLTHMQGCKLDHSVVTTKHLKALSTIMNDKLRQKRFWPTAVRLIPKLSCHKTVQCFSNSLIYGCNVLKCNCISKFFLEFCKREFMIRPKDSISTPYSQL